MDIQVEISVRHLIARLHQKLQVLTVEQLLQSKMKGILTKSIWTKELGDTQIFHLPKSFTEQLNHLFLISRLNRLAFADRNYANNRVNLRGNSEYLEIQRGKLGCRKLGWLTPTTIAEFNNNYF